MKKLILVFIQISSCLAFLCANIPQESLCSKATGCFWTQSCQGNFAPICSSPCYFVDPTLLTDNGDGTATNPFRILDTILSNNTEAVIYILNPQNRTQVLLTSGVTVQGNLTLRPYFDDYYFSILFSQIPSTTTSLIKVTGKLVIFRMLIVHRFAGIQAMYEMANGQMFWHDVSFHNCSSEQGYLIRIQKTYTNSNLVWNYGSIYNTTSGVQLQGGTVVLNNLRFDSTVTTGTIFQVSYCQFTVFNIFVRNCYKMLFFYILSGSQTTIQNSSFQDSNFTFLQGSSFSQLQITNCTFTNLKTVQASLINLFTQASASITISSSKFWNITVSYSLMLYELNGAFLFFDQNYLQQISQVIDNIFSLSDLSAWQTGLCVMTKGDTRLHISSSIFEEISGTCLGLSSTNVNITDSWFSNSEETLSSSPRTIKPDIQTIMSWVNLNDGAFLKSEETMVISRNTFSSNYGVSSYGGALTISGIIPPYLLLTNNIFLDNMAVYGGAIYIDNPLIQCQFQNNTFSGNSAFDGGAIYKITKNSQISNDYSLQISGDLYRLNSAKRNGGAIYINGELFQLEQSNFEANSAQNGGGLFASNVGSVIFKNTNKFKSNLASNAGGAILLLSEPLLLGPLTSVNNTDSEGKDVVFIKPEAFIFSFYEISPSDKINAEYTNLTFSNLLYSINTSKSSNQLTLPHKSGQGLKYLLEVSIQNRSSYIISPINEEDVQVDIASSSQNNSGSLSTITTYLQNAPVTVTFTNGSILIQDTLKLIGEVNTNVSLTFQSISTTNNLLNEAGLELNFQLNLSFVKCDPGDVYDQTTGICNTCSTGTFSLTDPYNTSECTRCDFRKMLCFGGSLIAPQKGYWRYDVNSANMIVCPSTQACLGGLVNGIYNMKGHCNQAYYGTLCNQCSSGYGKDCMNEDCLSCKRNILHYFRYFFSLILSNGFIFLLFKAALTPYSTTFSNLQILYDFAYMLRFLFQLPYFWPTAVQIYADILTLFISDGVHGFADDCVFNEVFGISMSFMDKNLIILFYPLILTIFLFVVRLVLWIKKPPSELQRLNEMKALLLTVFTITYPTISQAAVEVLRCQPLDSTNYILIRDSEMKCFSEYHLIRGFIVGISYFVMMGIIVPTLLWSMQKKRPSEFAFLSSGFKRESWRYVQNLKIVLFFVIYSFAQLVSTELQAFLFTGVLFIEMILTINIKPYVSNQSYELRIVILIVLACVSTLGLYCLYEQTNQSLKQVYIIVFIDVFMTVVVIFLFYFIKKKNKRKADQIPAEKITLQVTQKIHEDQTENIESPKDIQSSQMKEKMLLTIESEDSSFEYNPMTIKSIKIPTIRNLQPKTFSEGISNRREVISSAENYRKTEK